MQYAYEDRIAELRAKVDRTTSRQLLDQEQFDQKLDQIMRRQTTLESRATALGTIPDAAATGSIRPPARGAAAETPAFRHAEALPDQRHRDLRGAAGSRSAAGIARAHRRQAAAEPVRQGSGRRQRAGPPADLARFGRAAPDGGADFGRGQHGIARAPDARRDHRSRPRHGAARSRDAALGDGRPVRAGQAVGRCRRVRTPALPDQPHPRPDAAPQRARWRWCPTASP